MSLVRTNGSEQTRQQILTTSRRLFAAQGYSGTSTQAIVAASHVSKPMLYYYFGSKAQLFRLIVDDAESQLLETLSKCKVDTADVRRQLVGICAGMFQFAREKPSLVVLALELSSIARPCPFRRQCSGTNSQWHTVVVRLMDRAMKERLLGKQFDSEMLAVDFCGLVRNHILHFLSNPGWPLDRAMAERVVSFFLNGTVRPWPHFPQHIRDLRP